MLVKDLFQSVETLASGSSPSEFPNLNVTDVCFDSRKVTDGALFVCIEGYSFDGHKFVDEAISNGAVLIVASRLLGLAKSVPVVLVKNTEKALADLSANFFSWPSKELYTVGITGTKGKTTTAFMLTSILKKAGIKCGMIGTMGIFFNDQVIESKNTTPISYHVQKYLRAMVNSGVTHVVIEASSLAYLHYRLENVHFNSAIFTNFSEDHIGPGEHKDTGEYLECKGMLFQNSDEAFVNIDDSRSRYIINNSNCKGVKKFGIASKEADLVARDIELTFEGSELGICFVASGIFDVKVRLSMPGKFNVYNALAAFFVAENLGIEKREILSGLLETKVKGRMETVHIPDDCGFKVIIDYAHNPVSMQNLLVTLREYKSRRIVTVFGAGGNRPKARRYLMGRVSGRLSDFSVLTSDNSRFEKTLDIIREIEDGVKEEAGAYVVIPDRREAIKYAVCTASEGDIIVLAGKGHEDYEEVNGERRPFDERKIVKEVINGSR